MSGPDPLGHLFGTTDSQAEAQGGEEDAGEEAESPEATRVEGSFGGATPRGERPNPEVLASELPPNLEHWVEQMVAQSEEVSYRGVLLSDAFESFADGYGYDVTPIREALTSH